MLRTYSWEKRGKKRRTFKLSKANPSKNLMLAEVAYSFVMKGPGIPCQGGLWFKMMMLEGVAIDLRREERRWEGQSTERTKSVCRQRQRARCLVQPSSGRDAQSLVDKRKEKETDLVGSFHPLEPFKNLLEILQSMRGASADGDEDREQVSPLLNDSRVPDAIPDSYRES